MKNEITHECPWCKNDRFLISISRSKTPPRYGFFTFTCDKCDRSSHMETMVELLGGSLWGDRLKLAEDEYDPRSPNYVGHIAAFRAGKTKCVCPEDILLCPYHGR